MVSGDDRFMYGQSMCESCGFHLQYEMEKGYSSRSTIYDEVNYVN